ncbi:MAG: fumarylacetoacetate hydrolase family protein [Methanothrix sp.]|jgi:2-keto-4-pentenoate hydratase/2-oxohepta-3-ene-1,7-dioic acid hydratase in catechol pathway|uniref:5-carboxymethyl-2-hydroxymuconate delta-isomerase n=1 Tax=Methanothrix thermoacetophila (strain DSM 6194 / JCM 14653 / NBRC 101360 / PT) TaxID=349307 RepID=A0B6B9_METTP|nr:MULTISPECIES: fumarylacetoacetate hydrolase family protein [Methanothrix]ABK14243.1 5-carboxymethyl-2-hydroxymuconate delta-isomerase [Methanothrix thermoacetophila PT]MBC7079657.1 fumarylacetoacetate hydrolase family protein [Methanothrix sp.]NPU87731.1 2-hydroxyhepta-2,4-diene-1,7-dioate isomerase [Methanothrix sp.]
MIARFRYGDRVFDGDVDGDRIVSDGVSYELEEVKLLPPSVPTKVVCVGLNYLEHARELRMDLPDEPIIFLKPPSAVVGHDDEIILPEMSRRVDYEGELAVVISRRCRRISADEADDYILGYTCFNDVTARDLQQKDGQWTRSKSFDTFAPVGPWVAQMSVEDAEDLSISTRVNGETRQRSNTSDLIFGVAELVEFVSSIMTLEPGDVIATGTPPGVGRLESGDIVEVEIEGIGLLRNRAV